MKVLHLISSPSAGGAEIYVKDLAISLKKSGQIVHIGFTSRAVELGHSLDFEDSFLEDLENYKIPYFFVGHECRKNPLLGAWRVRRYCAENGIEVYHSHLKYAILFGFFLRVPHIHTHHNIAPGSPLFLYRFFNLFVDAYVGISRICSESLVRFTGRPVTTIFNGVDTEKISRFGGSVRCFSVPIQCIAVGRIQPQKNYALLLDALRLLPSDVRSVLRVAIAGEGLPDAKNALMAMIERFGLESTVTLLGNRTDVPILLGQSHLFLMTSAWEGFPIALIEATVSGLPFISTDVGGCKEIASAGGNGIVISNGDARAFAHSLESLVRDPERFCKLSSNAIANSHRFSIESSMRDHMELYRRLF